MAGALSTEVEPDAAALRAERRERALAAMDAAGIDILILGREANARYVAGVPRLWTAGSRPFTPGCVLVRATGDIHLLTTWDEGVPEDIPHEHLYGITFNPMNMVSVLAAVAGAATAKVVGTDSMTPMFHQLLPMAFPQATFVDGDAAISAARRIKTAAEIAEVRASVALAEACIGAAVRAVVPPVRERQITAAFMQEMAQRGVTTPTSQDVAWVGSTTRRWHRSGLDRVVADGDLVIVSGGVLRSGYGGEIGTTVVAGATDDARHDKVFAQADELRTRLLESCRAGDSSARLIDAYGAAGIEAPVTPIARGLGLGFDLPLVTPALADTAATAVFEVGHTFALTTAVFEAGVGTVMYVDPVVITEHGAESLASRPANGINNRSES